MSDTSGDSTKQLEAELLRRWQAGDKDAGSQLIRRISPMLIRYFRTHVGGDVQDLVQDALTRLAATRDNIREARSVRAFAYGIARLRLLEHLRELAKRDVIDPLTDSLADLCPGITTDLQGRQEARLVLHALQRLPLDSQAALHLYYIEKVSYGELTEYFGAKNASTMRSRMQANRELLRDAIAALDAPPSIIESTLAALDAWADELRAQFFDDLGE